MKIKICIFGLVLFGANCASIHKEVYESQSIDGKWEMACLRCAKPETFVVSFTANNQIEGNKATLCENLMPTALFPSFVIDTAKNCKVIWQRIQNENEVTIITGKLTAKYKFKQVAHKESNFFEAVYMPDVTVLPSSGKFEIIFLVKRIAKP